MDVYGNEVYQRIKHGNKIATFIYIKSDSKHDDIKHKLHEIIDEDDIKSDNNSNNKYNAPAFPLDKPLSNIAEWYKYFNFRFPKKFKPYESESRKTLEFLKDKNNIVGIWPYYARPSGDLQLLFILRKGFRNEYGGIIDTKIKYFENVYEIQHIWTCDSINFDCILSLCGLYLITTQSFRDHNNKFNVKIKINDKTKHN